MHSPFVAFGELKKDDEGDDDGKDICRGKTVPHARIPPVFRQDDQGGDEEDQLPRCREKDGELGLADGLEEVPDDNLPAHQRVGERGQPQPRDGKGGQLSLGIEDGGDVVRENLADEEAQRGAGRAPDDSVFESLPDSVEVTCSVVVADNGLHPLGDADDEHDEEEQDAIDDAIGTNGQVSPSAHEAAVDDDGDSTGTGVHQEGGHADGDDGQDDAPAKAVDSRAKVDGTTPFAEMEDDPHQTDGLGD